MSYYVNEINKAGKIAVDDTILVKSYPATAGSKMLENFVPLFSADSVERLENAGYVISGKTNTGEFGLDLVGEFSNYGPVTENGTLTSAAAALVSNGEIDAALSVDLNGAPRRAAAVSGIDFIKPTYGTVSRYGIIACACSGEQIGVSAKTTEKIAEILGVIAGHDSKDGTSLPAEKYEYSLTENVSGMKIALVKELYENADADVKAAVSTYKSKLEAMGAKVEEISIDFAKEAQTAWQILMSAETTNNLSRFDGVKYGYRTPEYKNIDELYVKSRSEAMNFLTKATIIYGSDVLSKGRYDVCYDKSLRLRNIVCTKMKELFVNYDAVLTACTGTKAYQSYDILSAFTKVFDESLYTAIPSITGMPALVTNGVQLIADVHKESTLLSIAHAVEKEA